MSRSHSYRLRPAQPGDEDVYEETFELLCGKTHPAIAAILAHDLVTAPPVAEVA